MLSSEPAFLVSHVKNKCMNQVNGVRRTTEPSGIKGFYRDRENNIHPCFIWKSQPLITWSTPFWSQRTFSAKKEPSIRWQTQVSCYTSAVMSLVKYPPQKKQSMCQLYASTILHHAIKTQPEMLLQSRYHIYWRKLFHAVTSSTNSFFWCHRGSTKKWFMSHPSVVCFPY